MFLSKASMRRPIAMTTLILCLVMFGILAYRTIGVDILPHVDVPYVTVTVIYAGASPDEIETSVAKRIEDAVVQVDGINHINTTCLNNFCQVLIEFQLDRDVDEAAADVREKVDLIKGDRPSAAEEPQILKYDINATPVVTIALKGSLPIDDLYDYADNTLADRFSSLGGVAKVDLVGGMEREVLVDVDRDKLTARGLSLAQIIQTMGNENIKIPVGQIDDHGREISLMFDAEAVALRDLGDIQIGVVKGERVYLRDVATFSFGTERVKTRATHDGAPCVLIKVTKRGEANAVEVVDNVRKVYEELKGTMPGGMELVWFRDDGLFTRAQVDDGIDSIWGGVILTGIVLLMFLADIRTAFVAFISIPVTVIIAMASFKWFGYTMNMITISAFGISVGILVANSIVVLENVSLMYSKQKKGFDVAEVTERATSMVGLAVAAGALTNIVVFLPIATMKSLSGRFLAPFGVTVTAATFASLLISFTLTPILAKLSYGFGDRINRVLQWIMTPWMWVYNKLEKGYVASMHGVVKFSWLFVILASALCIYGLKFYSSHVQADFVPQTDMADITIKLEFPADYNLKKTAQRAEKVAGILRKDPVVEHATVSCGKVQGMVGQVAEGTYLAEIQLRLKAKEDRPAGNEMADLLNRYRQWLSSESDCIQTIMIPSIAGGAQQDIQAVIRGPSLETLNQIGLTAISEIRKDPANTDVSHSIRPGRPEIRFRPNRAVLHDMGIPASAVGTSLRASVAGIEQSTYKRGDRSYDIRIRYTQTNGVEQLPALNLPGPDGKPIQLGSVVSQEENLQPTQIIRYDKVRASVLYANVAKGYGMGTAADNQEKIIRKHLPAGYSLLFPGLVEKMVEAVTEFKLVALVAVMLTYLLLAAIMESWTQPFMILMTVPFSYLGLYMGLYYTGMTMTIFGLLSGIMLVGVVVNAAILLIDEINVLRQQGVSKSDALRQAAERKFRPILMSCVAALFGMLPMAIGSGPGSEMRASMGVGAVGGILVSSVVSLYFIPAFYMMVGKRDRKQVKKV